MSVSLYNAINAAWDKAGGDMEKPPHLQVEEDEARKLDKMLSDLLKEPIDQFQNGLISAVELVNKIMQVALTPAP